jgi:hypothetical protein
LGKGKTIMVKQKTVMGKQKTIMVKRDTKSIMGKQNTGIIGERWRDVALYLFLGNNKCLLSLDNPQLPLYS